jgi:SAM-dependent methyltransferase
MIFDQDYARIYDFVHSDKDYFSEVQGLINILNEFKLKNPKILDFGCGTGRHAIEFSYRGFDISGFDTSFDMIEIAKRNFPNIEFINSITGVASEYDAIFSLFDVISYMDTSLLEQAVNQICKILKPKGLVVLEGWNLSGALNSPPVDRQKNFEVGGKPFTRKVRVLTNNPPIYELEISILDHNSDELYKKIHTMYAHDSIFVKELLVIKGLEVVSTQEIGSDQSLNEASWRFRIVARNKH